MTDSVKYLGKYNEINLSELLAKHNNLEKLGDGIYLVKGSVNGAAKFLGEAEFKSGGRSNWLELDFSNDQLTICSEWGGETNSCNLHRSLTRLTLEKRPFMTRSLLNYGDYMVGGNSIGAYGKNCNTEAVLMELKNVYGLFIEEKNNEAEEQEESRIKNLKVAKTNVLSELDKDGNGIVDIAEGEDFNKMLKANQDAIQNIDSKYLQQFVKLSVYLKTKKKNVQGIFDKIKDVQNQTMLNEYVESLKHDIYIHDIVLYNSLNMISCLKSNDMLTFYEIYELFDELNIFDSKYERDVSDKLNSMDLKLSILITEMRSVGNRIASAIEDLSFELSDHSNKIESHLQEINSTLSVGNLLTGIQAHQSYKMNKKLGS